MALAALFTKISLGPDDEDDEEDASQLVPNSREAPTLSFASTSKFDSINSLPRAKRKAFLDARAAKSIRQIREGSKGPCHFLLEKTGTSRRFDVVLGNPCTCRDHATNRAVEISTSLQLIYYVLVRLLLVEESDPVISLVPNLANGVVDRIIAQSVLARERALREENKEIRNKYELDDSEFVNKGEMEFLSLGKTDIPNIGGFRVHPKLKRFDGMPPVLLREPRGAAVSLGDAMAAVDTVSQVEALWGSTLKTRQPMNRKRLKTAPFGQESSLPTCLVQVEKQQVDPHWDFAKTHASSAYPWRRELSLCEKVALLSKEDTSEDITQAGDGVYSPVRRHVPNSRTNTRAGMDSTTGLPSTMLDQIPKYPYNTAGGRVVVDEGTVLPAGMGIRHPALARAPKFRHNILEYLSLWSLSGDRDARLALGQKIDSLWAKHLRFREWARAVYLANRNRVKKMREKPIRITMQLPDSRSLGLSISPLATGFDLRKMLEYKLKKSKISKSRGKVQSLKTMSILYEGVPIDDRVSLFDSGVRERSTLTLTRVPAQMMNGDDGLPVY